MTGIIKLLTNQYQIERSRSGTLSRERKSMNTPTNVNAGECSPASPCSARPTPKEIAETAWANGHVPIFLKALCELLMCSDPWPASTASEIEVKAKADEMARKLGFSDWVEAYHRSGPNVEVTQE